MCWGASPTAHQSSSTLALQPNLSLGLPQNSLPGFSIPGNQPPSFNSQFSQVFQDSSIHRSLGCPTLLFPSNLFPIFSLVSCVLPFFIPGYHGHQSRQKFLITGANDLWCWASLYFIYILFSTWVRHRAGSRNKMRWSPFIEGLWIARMPADHAWHTPSQIWTRDASSWRWVTREVRWPNKLPKQPSYICIWVKI